MPELRRDAAVLPDRGGEGLSQLSESMSEPLASLMNALSAAHVHDARLLASVLRTDPVRADMNAVLVQLGPEHTLPILEGLTTAALPDRREVLDALLSGGAPGSAQTLHLVLQAAHRQELLAAIFHPGRVQSLRRACQSFTKEPT